MKKFTIILATVAVLMSNGAFAQTAKSKGQANAAQAGNMSSSDNFAWGIGLGALAVVGVVVGITAASASSSPSTFSH